MTIRFALALVVTWLAVSAAAAHETRPAYLELREVAGGRYDILWKRPALGDRTLALAVSWPAPCTVSASRAVRVGSDATIERGRLDCGTSSLIGRRIGIDGLRSTTTDTLVRIAFGDGASQTNLVKPSQPWLVINGPRPKLDVAADYFKLGVGHILFGFDHLLFVLGLTLIVRGWASLMKTITAFTVAHSMTLALATLGYVTVPPAPVEAAIALSILVLAVELMREVQGTPTLTSRAPWLVAFAFGLLHGFGFAGALSEVGLPQREIPMALLAFNLGVEAGQLAFVGATLAILAGGRHFIAAPPGWLRLTPAYAIGPIAAFWLLSRLAAFV